MIVMMIIISGRRDIRPNCRKANNRQTTCTLSANCRCWRKAAIGS